MLALAFTFFGCSDDNDNGDNGDNTISSSSGVENGSSSSGDSGNGLGSSGTFTDSRDEKEYKYVKIGTQIWMAENLNYIPTDTDLATNSECYDNDEDNCDIYGKLYDWATAMALPEKCNEEECTSQIKIPYQGICPDGWHIPSNDDWYKLLRYVDGVNGTGYYESLTGGTKLKSSIGWNSSDDIPHGTDAYGFSALPGGSYYDYGNKFNNIGRESEWWSSDDDGSSRFACGVDMDYSREWARLTDSRDKIDGNSVRCVKD